MKGIIFALAEITLSMSMVILALMLVFRLFGRQLRSSTKYIIWMLVVFRLAIPFFGISSSPLIELTLPWNIGEEEIVTDIGGGNYTEDVNHVGSADLGNSLDAFKPNDGNIGVGNNVTHNPTVVPPAQSAGDGSSLPSDSNNSLIGGEVADKTPAIDQELTVNKVSYAVYIPHMLVFVWLFGAVCFFTINLAKYFVFSKRLCREARPVDEKTYCLYKNICAEMGLKKRPRLLVSNGISGPMLFGFINNTVIVPDTVISDGELCFKNVTKHELIHYKRMDLWVKLVSLVSNSLNWFNPLVYIAVNNLNSEMELSCDDAVLKSLSEEGKIRYGKTLVAVANKSRSVYSGLTTCFDPKKSAVKKRVSNILDYTKKKSCLVLVIIVLVVCIMVGLVFGVTSKKDAGSDNGENDTEAVDKTDKDSSKENNVPENGDYTLKYFDDGSFVFVSSDKKKMSIKDEYGVLELSNLPVYTGESELLRCLKNDIDNDGVTEYLFVLTDNNYEIGIWVVDGENGNYTIYEISESHFEKEINNRLSYVWDGISETLSVKFDGKAFTDIRLKGAFSQSGAVYEGWKYSISGVYLSENAIGVDINKDGIFRIVLNAVPIFKDNKNPNCEVEGFITLNASYNGDGAVACSVISPYYSVNAVYSDYYNTQYISNSPDWNVYGDVNGDIVIDNKKGEVYRFGHSFRDKETETDKYIQVSLTDTTKMPEIIVSSDGRYIWLLYNRSVFAISGYQHREALFIETNNAPKNDKAWSYADKIVDAEFIFDKHDISSEIRNKYNYQSQMYNTAYYVEESVTELSPGLFRKTYVLKSYDGTMILKGHTDYDFVNKKVSEYVVSATELRDENDVGRGVYVDPKNPDNAYEDIISHMRLLVDYVYEPCSYGNMLTNLPIKNYLLWYCYQNREKLGFVRVDDVFFYVKESDLMKLAEAMFGPYVQLVGKEESEYKQDTGEFFWSHRTDYLGGGQYSLNTDYEVLIVEEGSGIKVTAVLRYYGYLYRAEDRMLEYSFVKTEYNGLKTYKLVSVSDVTPGGAELPLPSVVYPVV